MFVLGKCSKINIGWNNPDEMMVSEENNAAVS